MTDFYLKVKQQQEQQLPFVIYRKPEDKRLTGYFQENDHLYFVDDYTESGFVFAPFSGDPKIYFPVSKSEIETAGWFVKSEILPSKTVCQDDSQSDFFMASVEKAVDSIKAGEFKKVVLSRKENCTVTNFDAITAFENMLNKYPSAFVYCWFHPKIGMWLGASPEQLLRCEGNRFYSVSLAGTQKFNGSMQVDWPQKERDEQQFVTDFVLENMRAFATELSVSSPYTARAGNLVHIKTDIEGQFKDGFSVKQAVSAIHPTPAVCGLPRLKALEFIVENENYDREHYTGFLGEINVGADESQTDLFVNLRCAKIVGDVVSVYVGCGITLESDPLKEYNETVEKSKTIKEIL